MQNYRKRMIFKAIQLLPTHGYAGITLVNVARACNAPRGSLYHYFPGGKEELMEAVLDAAKEYGLGELISACARAPTLNAYIGDIAHALSDGLHKSNFELGCPVAAISMSTERNSALNQKCAAIHGDWCLALETKLFSYGVPQSDAKELSINMLNAFQGGLLHARIMSSDEPIQLAALLLQREALRLATIA